MSLCVYANDRELIEMIEPAVGANIHRLMTLQKTFDSPTVSRLCDLHKGIASAIFTSENEEQFADDISGKLKDFVHSLNTLEKESKVLGFSIREKMRDIIINGRLIESLLTETVDAVRSGNF